MKKRYNLEYDIRDNLFSIKDTKYDKFIKIFWNDLDRLVLDTLSLHKFPNSFVSRNQILFNCLENSTNPYLLFIHNLFFSKKKYIPRKFINHQNAVTWNNNPIIQNYAKNNNLKLQYSRNYDWFDKKENISFNEKDFGNVIFAKIEKIILTFSKDQKLKKKLVKDLNLFYSWANHQLNFNSSLKMPKYFLSATMGSPLNRIMAINVLKNHGKVFVFDHGVGAGLKRYGGERVIYDLVFSTRLITFNSNMKLAINENIKLLKKWILFYRKDKLKIEYLKQTHKIKKHKKFRLEKIVFLLASVEEKYFKGSRGMHQNIVIFNMVKKISFFCKIMKIDFYVKIHPVHTSKKFLNLLKKEKIDIYDGKFENISWKNSLFIIDNLETSAFRLACITDNPIIFFDQKRFTLTNIVKKEINKRCEKLNWILSTENVILDKQSFFKAIKKSISKRKNNNLIKHLY